MKVAYWIDRLSQEVNREQGACSKADGLIVEFENLTTSIERHVPFEIHRVFTQCGLIVIEQLRSACSSDTTTNKRKGLILRG